MKGRILLFAWTFCGLFGCGVETRYLGSYFRGAIGGAPSSIDAGEGGLGTEASFPLGEILPLEAALKDGAVRIVDYSSRRTVTWTGSQFSLAAFEGGSPQMWLLGGSETALVLTHDATSECLAGDLVLGTACDETFEVLTVRPRTDDAPSLFRIRKDGSCLVPEDGSLTFGDCRKDTALLALEPSGWGRRTILETPEFTAKMALLVKGIGALENSGLTLDVPSANQDAVRQSFRECTKIWIASLTDGRVGFESESFVSPHAVEAVEPSCGGSVPRRSEVDLDYAELIDEAAFDGVLTYYRAGSFDAPWSCVGLGGPEGRGLGFQAFLDDDDAWLSCTPEPSAAFLQAVLAINAAFYAERGVPGPEDGILGGSRAEYAVGEFSWNHFRRDYFLGRIIREDFTYGGLGPRAFSLGPIRDLVAP